MRKSINNRMKKADFTTVKILEDSGIVTDYRIMENEYYPTFSVDVMYTYVTDEGEELTRLFKNGGTIITDFYDFNDALDASLASGVMYDNGESVVPVDFEVTRAYISEIRGYWIEGLDRVPSGTDAIDCDVFIEADLRLVDSDEKEYAVSDTLVMYNPIFKPEVELRYALIMEETIRMSDPRFQGWENLSKSSVRKTNRIRKSTTPIVFEHNNRMFGLDIDFDIGDDDGPWEAIGRFDDTHGTDFWDRITEDMLIPSYIDVKDITYVNTWDDVLSFSDELEKNPMRKSAQSIHANHNGRAIPLRGTMRKTINNRMKKEYDEYDRVELKLIQNSGKTGYECEELDWDTIAVMADIDVVYTTDKGSELEATIKDGARFEVEFQDFNRGIEKLANTGYLGDTAFELGGVSNATLVGTDRIEIHAEGLGKDGSFEYAFISLHGTLRIDHEDISTGEIYEELETDVYMEFPCVYIPLLPFKSAPDEMDVKFGDPRFDGWENLRKSDDDERREEYLIRITYYSREGQDIRTVDLWDGGDYHGPLGLIDLYDGMNGTDIYHDVLHISNTEIIDTREFIDGYWLEKKGTPISKGYETGKTYNIRRNHAIRKRMAKFDPSSIGMGGNTTLDSLTLDLEGVGTVDMRLINTDFGPKLQAFFTYKGIVSTVTADMDGFFDFGKISFTVGDKIFGDDEEVSISRYKSTAEYVWAEEIKPMIDEGGIRKSSVRKGYETEGEGDDRREFLSVNLDDVGTVRLEYDPNYEGVVYKGGFEFHGIHFTIEIRPEMSMTISHNGNGSSVSQELYMTDNEDDMVGLANDMWSEFKTAMYIDAPIHKQESLPDTFTVELPQLGDVTMSLYNTTTSGKAYSGTFDYNTDSITIKTFVTDDYFDITIYDDTNLPGIHESTEDIPDPSFARVKSGIRLFWTGNVWEKIDRAQKERNAWMSKSGGLTIKSRDGTDITNMTVREMVKRRVR